MPAGRRRPLVGSLSLSVPTAEIWGVGSLLQKIPPARRKPFCKREGLPLRDRRTLSSASYLADARRSPHTRKSFPGRFPTLCPTEEGQDTCHLDRMFSEPHLEGWGPVGAPRKGP